MMLTSTRKKMAAKLNCQEAYVLWDLTSAKQQCLQNLLIWDNFAHDTDLKFAIGRFAEMLKKHVKKMEEMMKQFSINGPSPGVKNINTAANMEIYSDQFIAKNMLMWLQEGIELILRSFRITSTNDQLRQLFYDIAIEDIKFLDNFIKYIRINSWLGSPPLYLKIPPEEKEKLDASEAFHLWDQLTFRYDNIALTETFKDLAKDVDLKTLFEAGLQLALKKQATVLEKECSRFGIPLPSQQPSVISIPTQLTNYAQDELLYRNIYFGIIGATVLHALAVKQCVTNDRVRKIFIDLLISEIEIQNRFLKYGKMKGYIHTPPEYSTMM